MIQSLERRGRVARLPPALIPPPPRSPTMSYGFLQNVSMQIQIRILIPLCVFYIYNRALHTLFYILLIMLS